MANLLAQHWHMPSSPQGQLPASLFLSHSTHMPFKLPAETTSSMSGTPSDAGMPLKRGGNPTGCWHGGGPQGGSMVPSLKNRTGVTHIHYSDQVN